MAYIQNARFNTEKPVPSPAVQIGYRGHYNRQPVQQLRDGLGEFEWGSALQTITGSVLAYKGMDLQQRQLKADARLRQAEADARARARASVQARMSASLPGIGAVSSMTLPLIAAVALGGFVLLKRGK